MENPEEILHSLEEFSKMKPKDIPRELEEYLKFVAKTGDPVYQWSAIKSLFREKLISVITEFYESCSSIEIPPCPNVDMFNYDLMKNFILEKLDTFASAPFTLQRICELLTSPRKEYTRIDKYMRALEKNILVVSTMEPGGRRTENGDGIMNGIESDHEPVPEPGNEINVEEMDDSPSWPQNIQTNNHVSEHISFDNPSDNPVNEYQVSTSNQEIVCVQYVSVEPLASEDTPIKSEEVKDSDISVTITAVDSKKGDVNKEESATPESQSQPVLDVSKEIIETANKPEIEIEVETKMDIEQTVESIEDSSSNTLKDIVNIETASDPLSDDILSTTTSEKPSLESEQLQAPSLEAENAEIESVSPETSVTSSENFLSESNPSTDASPNNLNVDNSALETLEEKLETPDTSDNKQILKKDSSGDVDSTTKPFEGDNIEIEVTKVCESTDSEVAVLQVDSKEPQLVQDTQKAEIDSSTVCEDTIDTETPPLPEAIPKIEMLSEALEQQENPQTKEVAEHISEEISKTKELFESKSDDSLELKSQEISLIPEEKEVAVAIPMEVDVVSEKSSDSNEEDKPTLEEPETSEPPV